MNECALWNHEGCRDKFILQSDLLQEFEIPRGRIPDSFFQGCIRDGSETGGEIRETGCTSSVRFGNTGSTCLLYGYGENFNRLRRTFIRKFVHPHITEVHSSQRIPP